MAPPDLLGLSVVAKTASVKVHSPKVVTAPVKLPPAPLGALSEVPSFRWFTQVSGNLSPSSTRIDPSSTQLSMSEPPHGQLSLRIASDSVYWAPNVMVRS